MFGFNQNDDGSCIFEDKGDTRRKVFSVSRDGFFDPNYAQRVMLFDDFLGDVLADQYSGNSGADGADPAIVAAANGECHLVSGSGATSAAANASSLTHGLNWKAANGKMFMEARVSLSALTGGHLFIGFTDVLASGTCEIPFTMATATLTSNATDAVGFFYDDAATSTNFQVAGVKADTDQSGDLTNNAADTSYHIFRVEVDEDGHAKFYIDGVLVYGLANAVTASVALTPCVVCSVAASGDAKTGKVDYLFVGQDR